ncbi:MAG: hypothetical protein JST00_10590 [Deltaproteobacteria bacterium]|nr:hypothetical protein [Deltaproteobacteria bacterium]
MKYAKAHLFPVRHHSPRTSHVLRAMLDRVKPSLVLVEGPEDADHLIDAIVDPESVPPIAILGYRTDGTPGSSLWPFASYSPEYVALRWARANGAEVRFCDLTTGQSIARHARSEDAQEKEEPEPEAGDDVGDPDFRRAVAEARGFRSFEEFWEASFEAPDYEEASFREALVAFADVVRHEGADVDYHRARDAFMAQRIDEAVAAGTPPGSIVAVLGAAHAAALAAGDVDPALLPTLSATVPTTTTLVPYSFPRLAEQTGYGAGNRAPQFYQRAWDNQLSFRRAALEVLVDFCDHLRLRGFMASLADTIEAYRLACMLADIRGKSDPGLDELREATIATMCRGEAAHVDTFLWPTVIGKNLGRVASRIGKNSLQEEFWREVGARRLPASDEPEDFTLKLGDSVQVESSIFLHRLRVADVPYASYLGSSAGPIRVGPAGPTEEAGGYAALSRVRESWRAQWTPATDVALIEAIVHGETLERVCELRLSARLADARSTSDAADVLLESVVASAPETISTSLAACDRLAATDDDLPSLARACRALSGLVAYGSSRAEAKHGEGPIRALAVKTFDRSILRVHDACIGNDEAVVGTRDALRVLHEIAMSQPVVDKSAWVLAARALVNDYTVNAGCSGMAAGLLYLARELTEEEIALVVEQRVSDVVDPGPAATFLSGFLEVNALVLVKSKPVVAALDAFLVGIDKDRFRDALPTLRRAFSTLGKTERRYLVENLVSLRKIGAGAAREAAAVIAAKDKEKLAAMSEEIGKAMDDLDDLL